MGVVVWSLGGRRRRPGMVKLGRDIKVLRFGLEIGSVRGRGENRTG